MTPEELLAIGCRVINWNPAYNGGSHEYYLPIEGEGLGRGDVMLSVTFRGIEYPRYLYMAWLVMPHYRFALKNITTIEQFEQLYHLLKGVQP